MPDSSQPDFPMRGGLIGCGFVAQHHLAAWNRFSPEEARLAAICDIRAERREWASAIVPRARVYENADAMLSAEALDFVEICTRPGSHRFLVELAASYGCDVLCQKPAGESLADLHAMVQVCERKGVRLMIHENWRFRPWYRALKSALDDGLIGRPTRLRMAHHDMRALMADGFADQPYFAEMPRLILFEMGSHLIDTARFLMGEASSVSATLGRFGVGHMGEDVAMLSLQFQDGSLGLLDISWCTPAARSRPEWALNETVVEGLAGSLSLEVDGSLLYRRPGGRTRTIPVELPPDDEVYLQGYLATQQHFVTGIRHGSPHETSGRETLKTMELLWAGYRSAEEGRVVDIN